MQNDNMLDFSSKYELIEPGTYEARIDAAEFKESNSGKKFIGITFVIREDVNQQSAGRLVWDNIWEGIVYRDSTGKVIKKADYDNLAPNQKASIKTSMEYNMFKLRKLVQCQDTDEFIVDENKVKTPNPEYKARFGNLEEVVMFLNGMNLQIQVTKYMDDASGFERNGVEYKGMKRTAVGPSKITVSPTYVNHMENNASQPNTTGEISEDDLPF